ncbi:MAG: YkgJ family cysteine cluster protein [Nitrosomonadales bacterium]|nr:YkgJ family cysteine cluster protein [Nitrosomonadales bacterium]
MDTYMAADLPFHGSPVVPEMCDGSKSIRFQCRKGIACWNACCSNIDISLTPYDILRLKQRLNLSSGEFLQQYTVPYELEKDGIVGVKLRPVENGTACRFMTPEGCGVYEDRPTSCRYYPVALLSMRRQDEYTDTRSYALVKESHCLGHNEPRELTIDEYRSEQGVAEYDELARGWRQLILKKKSSGPSIGKPSKSSLQMFFMVCYDIDRFRAFVVSEGFNELYDLDMEETIEILGDDTRLMLFGFRFLKQVLFGENTIPLKEDAATKRMERYRDKLQKMEQEAVERRMAEQDGMYEEPDA